MLNPNKPTDQWEFYVDEANERRWRHTTENNLIIGAATEGFKNRRDVWENARFNGYPHVRVSEEIRQESGQSLFIYRYDFGTNNGWPRQETRQLSDLEITEPIQWLLGAPGIELVEITRAA